MSVSDEEIVFDRFPDEIPKRSMYARRGISPMSLQSFPHSSRMHLYQPSYSQNTSELMNNKKCRSPMSVRSNSQWGYNNRCLSTMSVRSNDSNVSALDIQFALKDMSKFNKHDLKIIKNSIDNAYKQLKFFNYDRRRIAKRRNLKSFLKKCRRRSDSADDDDDNGRRGESGADGSDSSISDDCRSTRSAFYARHITRGRAIQHKLAGGMKMDFSAITEQVRDSQNYKDCTANIKQSTLMNSLGRKRTLDHSLAPRHCPQNIAHDSSHQDNNSRQLTQNDPISMKDNHVEDSMHLPYERFNKNVTYQHIYQPNQLYNITHDNKNSQLSETQTDQFRKPQNGFISLKDRLAKDTFMFLPCQRFSKKVKVSYSQKPAVHQEQSTNFNTYDEDIFPTTSGTNNLTRSDSNNLQQRVPSNNSYDDEEIFVQSNRTQISTNTLNQKRILDNVASSQTKRTKLLTLSENKVKETLPKRRVMKQLVTKNNDIKKTTGLNKETVWSGLEQYWQTDLESEEEGPMTSSSLKTLQKDQQKNKQNNEDDFNFKKPQLPLKKLGTVVRHNQSDILIAQSSQPLVGNVEPMFNQVRENLHPVADNENKETRSEENYKQPTQNLCDIVSNKTIADSTHNSTDVSMRSSFIKRKLFTQTLDMAQDKNISSESMSSPQTRVLRACREKNRVRKLTSQSCLSREVKNDSNYLDLIHKIVPPEVIKNQNINNSNVNKEKTSKASQKKQDKWDVSLAISTCSDDPKSDTFTEEEEIFNMPQENKRAKPIKKTTVKCTNASQSNQNLSNCNVVIEKLTPLNITNNIDLNSKKPSGLTKKSVLRAVGTFWDTDFTDEEEPTPSYSVRIHQKNQQENKENYNKSPNSSTGSTSHRNAGEVLKNNNSDANRVKNNHIDNKSTKQNSKQEMLKARNTKSTKNINQTQSVLNKSRESLRLKQKKQSNESHLTDENHNIESPPDECNTSRQSLRLKLKKLANSCTNDCIDSKSTRKNSKQEKPKPETQSKSFNISRESLRILPSNQNNNIEPPSKEQITSTKKPIRVAKLNCSRIIHTNRRK